MNPIYIPKRPTAGGKSGAAIWTRRWQIAAANERETPLAPDTQKATMRP